LPIKVLPQTLINQIAAGEVIVRMASVVKETVENAIDAGASRIEVALRNDMRDVEIRDDGQGMSREDAELSLQRHATSKIQTVEDLFHLQTRGFRGEALPSIASVSRMEIQTRADGALSGTRVVVEGGRIERIEPVGCPVGTRIMVRDLFYNTPARRKFLKSTTSEMNAVMSTITRQAIAQPHIGFRVERDGRGILDVPPKQNLSERFASILGSQIKGELLALDFGRENVHVTGLLAHPHDARGDRRSQFLFVNERPFAAKSLVAALEQACRGYVMVGRFPIMCIFIDVPPEEVDFNVHPTKDEVRFRNERFVAGTVYHAARGALEGSSALIGEVRFSGDKGSEQQKQPEGNTQQPSAPAADRPLPPPPDFFKSPDQLVRRVFDRKQERRETQADWLMEKARAEAPAQEPPKEKPRGKPLMTNQGETIAAGPGEQPDHSFWTRGYDPEPLGQIALTYILVRFGDELLIIDQHAVHERLVYIGLQKRPRHVASQSLLVPITMELDPGQSESLRELLPHFAAMGYEIGGFGPRTWAINSLPADLPEFDPVPLIIETIGDLEESRRIHALEDLRDRILIRTACHSAIRAGEELSLEKMRALLEQIKAERLSFTCPHGRPTIVRLSKTALDKQFKRVV